jgi:hypothetical protein
VIAHRWRKVLPAVIAECQHGFVYGRRQFENVMKIRDACAMVDMTADGNHHAVNPGDTPPGYIPGLLLVDPDQWDAWGAGDGYGDDDMGAYICDRDKAFDRVCHLWLVRALCRMCGYHCEWRPTLDAYLTTSPVATGHGWDPLPDAVRWIVVLLNDHHRRAVINGQKTDAWTLLCSVFQGCPLAPQLYAVACEFEGRLQIADPRVVGMTPPRPCDLLTDWCADIIAARFADDTQNVVWTRSLHPMLDNNGIWCKGTGGGTQVVKQELTLRGSRRGDALPWEGAHTPTHPPQWTPDGGDGKLVSRTRFRWHNESVTMLGVQDRARAVPDATHVADWHGADDDPRHPTQAQLDAVHAREHYDKAHATVLTQIRILSTQYELTPHARREALLTLAWSNVWFITKYDPPEEDAEWLQMLTEVSYRYLLHGSVVGITNVTSAAAARSSYKRGITEDTMSAHLHDGGLAFPKPVHTIRAVQCETMLQLLEPYGANQPRPTGAAWDANTLTMILRAAGAPSSLIGTKTECVPPPMS